ncbi:SAICAR synthase-like protein [Rhizodiscina lignyota]|uniref:SAICAR synthase-like protein n=1 Tax=Rhizodiscina lignyota TaxID=1504668 RepID=A0A9P4IEZ8_9PEZI|nr:SAICAR synthase-like protein [Rhizodiscina lignyota]
MGRRDAAISDAILKAIFKDKQGKANILLRILAFFSLFRVALARYEDGLFKHLREEVWQLDEDEYRESFRRYDKKVRLRAIGDLGYSGSTFFTTANSKFLIKSLPRRFENTFFQNELLKPYYEHMSRYPSSLLVRITDFLYTPYKALGTLLGIAPSHHIIMENVLYGKSEDPKGDNWETYDLKPVTYFFPERDIAGGRLAPESVKERLIDRFEDKVRVTSHQRDDLVEMLVQDTKLLEAYNAIDYSLFLVRYPAPNGDSEREIPTLPSPTAGPWRDGVTSADKKWVYRAVILDFFWAKHKLEAKAMTGLIKSYNMIDHKGPMSITTSPPEYRTRFLNMVEELFEIVEA